MTEIYLDNGATTPPLPFVADAVARAMVTGFGNPSSQHGRGRMARAAVDEARDKVAAFLGATPDRIVFTSGATEANDAVLRAAFQDPTCRLIAAEGDHPSLRGFFAHAPDRVVELPVDRRGLFAMKALARALDGDGPALVAVSWANGETGVVQRVDELCRLVNDAGHRVLLDATQAAGLVPTCALPAGCDYMTASAHKMNGPQGVGCLVLGPAASCPPMAMGGGQEDGRRSGTENVPAIVGFGVACAERARTLDDDLARMTKLRDLLEARLADRLSGLRINGRGAPRSATTSSVTIPGVDGMALVARCDAAGLRCSQVSACSSGRPEPSRALLAMGVSEEDAFASLRFSVSVMSTTYEIEAAVEIVVREAQALRDLMGEMA